MRAGGAERIRSLTDRVWFKVKTSDHRGAAGEVATPQPSDLPDRGWWLVASGHRQADSPTRDFYDRLESECRRAGKGSGGPSSSGLDPADVDFRRWFAESVARAEVRLRVVVREAIARSAGDGRLWTVSVPGYVVGALVRCEEGESYLAITAEGFYDPRIVAVLLAAVPGVRAEEWVAEPGPVLGIEPAAGQVVFSTMLAPDVLAALLTSVQTT